MDVLTEMLDMIAAEAPGAIRDRERIERSLRVRFGADRYYVASANALDRAARNRAVVRAVSADNLTMTQAAERFGIPRSTAHYIVQSSKSEP